MSRLKGVFRAERLLPLLAGVVALAMVAVVVVIATGGDDAAEPVAEPVAADRAKPTSGELDTGTGEDRKAERREEPEAEDQQPEPEVQSPQPEPEAPAATRDGDGQDSDAPSRDRVRKELKEEGISCAEQEKASGGDPRVESFLEEWFGPCRE